MPDILKSFSERILDRLRWIARVTIYLGGNPSSKLKLLFGGLWFFLNDTWKTPLKFTATVQYFGRSNDFQFKDLSDFGLFNEVFLDTSYTTNPHTDINKIVDLGSNVGVSALYFRLLYPQATIYCVEPDPNNIEQLQVNADLIGNMKIFKAAAWSSDGHQTFYVNNHRGSSSSVRKSNSNHKKTKVPTRSLDSILELANIQEIDLLKFDIEGSEEEVFRSFSQFGKIGMIFGEIHGDLCNSDQVIQILKKNFNSVELQPLHKDQRWYIQGFKKHAKAVG